MPTQDTSQIKDNIILVVKKRGPSLPVHIAKEVQLSILFTSVFLSELLSEKRIKMSNMKIGNSKIYFIPGQQNLLEKFSQHLKSKERDAFMILKEKKIIKDDEQDPAIRVALRAINDFAIPFTKNQETYWRYFTISEDEFKEKPIIPIQSQENNSQLVPSLAKKHSETNLETINQEEKQSQISQEEKQSQISQEEKQSQISQEEKQSQISQEKIKSLNIFDKEKPKKKTTTKKQTKKKPSQKNNDKFFNQVKEHLSEKSIEILDIEGFSKNELTLKVSTNNQETLLIAYNKKRINETDIIKANKKATELNLSYILLSLGEPLKKLNDLIEAVKNLKEIKKIE